MNEPKMIRIGAQHGWQEECQCDLCGWPLLERDTGYMDGKERVFCSRTCFALVGIKEGV